jgi:formylmethanofuran dehydrogenase subunit E
MRLRIIVAVVGAVATAFAGQLPTPAHSQTVDDWVTLGTRVHGGFGAFIPVGIRIGLEALERLKAPQRQVTVLYYDSDNAPCACVADGVAIATSGAANLGDRI